MSDPQYHKYPLLHLSQHIFQISNPSCPPVKQQTSLEGLQNAIKEHKMAPLYKHLAHPIEGILNPVGEGSASSSPSPLRRQGSALAGMLASRTPSPNFDLAWDEQLYEQLKTENEKELETIQKEEDDAVEKEGETEIQAARAKRAEFWARVGDKVSVFVVFAVMQY